MSHGRNTERCAAIRRDCIAIETVVVGQISQLTCYREMSRYTDTKAGRRGGPTGVPVARTKGTRKGTEEKK